MTIESIIELAHKFSRARAKLNGRCSIIQRAMNRLKFGNRKELALAATAVGAAYTDLERAIDSNRGLFDKPKTVVIDDIKFGLRKKKGTMSWDDDAALIERIRDAFPAAQAVSLIRTKESPDAEALNKLTAAELRQIGVSITNDTDAVTISPVGATEVEKLAAEFLKIDDEKEEKSK